jgi:integrase
MVRKREDGRWEGRIVIGHKENGAPIFHYLSAGTQKELLEKLHRCMEEYDGAELTEDCRMTLGEWLEVWLTECAKPVVRPSTFEGYRAYVRDKIVPYLGDKEIRKVTAGDVQKLYRKLKKEGGAVGGPLAGATVRRIHGVLHQAMDVAADRHLIVKNPTKDVTLPKKESTPRTILNDAQLERFMEAIKQDRQWHDFFYLEITTGLRRGELYGLMWSDFDEKKGTLSIRRTLHGKRGGGYYVGDTKTGKGRRIIRLPPSTVQLLTERKRTAISQWIFPTPLHPEDPIMPSSGYDRMKRLLAETGLPDLRFHDLRHTFATASLEHGMDVKTLSTIIGHVSSSTTLNIYAHVTDEMQRTAAAKIDRGIAKSEAAQEVDTAPRKPPPSTFQPYKGQRRKPGTGCVSQISETLWEGRYSPTINGKRMARNIYAPTEGECEEKLSALIREMKQEIASIKSQTKAI